MYGRQWDRTISNRATWVDQDPLRKSRVLVRVQLRLAAFDSITDNTANTTELRAHYGRRLFKCACLWCTRSLRGFETESGLWDHERSQHCEWQCSALTRPFYGTQFLTEGIPKEHTEAMSAHHLEAAVTLCRINTGMQDAAGLETLSFYEIRSLVKQTLQTSTVDDADTLSFVQKLRSLPSWTSRNTGACTHWVFRRWFLGYGPCHCWLPRWKQSRDRPRAWTQTVYLML